jgi:hypothetical protein
MSTRIISLACCIFAFTVGIFVNDVAYSQSKSKVVWTYESPPGFDFLEPEYRFPTQIKQILIDHVKGNSGYEKEYKEYYADQYLFKPWLVRILNEELALHRKLKSEADEKVDKLRDIVKKLPEPRGMSMYQLKQMQNLLENIGKDEAKYKSESDKESEKIAITERHIDVAKAWADSSDSKPKEGKSPKKRK